MTLDVVTFLVVVVGSLLFLALVWWTDFGPSARRSRQRRDSILAAVDAYDRTKAVVGEDQADDVVTWEQVAELLPADVVRAIEGRRPVLKSEPPGGPGGYPRVIVYPANGGEPYEYEP